MKALIQALARLAEVAAGRAFERFDDIFDRDDE